jgi:hypothetical protein
MQLCCDYSHHFMVRGKNVSGHAGHYLTGLLGRERRKNIECIEADVAESDYQGMQQFITDSPWSHEAVMAQPAAEAAAPSARWSRSAPPYELAPPAPRAGRSLTPNKNGIETLAELVDNAEPEKHGGINPWRCDRGKRGPWLSWNPDRDAREVCGGRAGTAPSRLFADSPRGRMPSSQPKRHRGQVMR